MNREIKTDWDFFRVSYILLVFIRKENDNPRFFLSYFFEENNYIFKFETRHVSDNQFTSSLSFSNLRLALRWLDRVLE